MYNISMDTRYAKNAGAVTSFDLNFRAKLWTIWGGEKKAAEVIQGIVESRPFTMIRSPQPENPTAQVR
jgi:sugar/nucleoside kinase (ribokinase family)